MLRKSLITLTLACALAPLQALSDNFVIPNGLKAWDGDVEQVDKADKKAAVPGYRIAFVTGRQAAAREKAPDGSVFKTADGLEYSDIGLSVNYTVRGISYADMQEVADKAYADFLAKLAAAGVTVMPADAMKASAGFAKLELTSAPYSKKPFGGGKTYTVVSPSALPLWFAHFDGEIGDKFGAALGNWKALNKLSADSGSATLVPTIVIDITRIETKKDYSNGGTTITAGAKDALVIHPLTVLFSGYAKFAMAGDTQMTRLKKPVLVSGDVGGAVTDARDSGGAGAVASALTGTRFMDADYTVDRTKFMDAAMKAAIAVNDSLIEKIKDEF